MRFHLKISKNSRFQKIFLKSVSRKCLSHISQSAKVDPLGRQGVESPQIGASATASLLKKGTIRLIGLIRCRYEFRKLQRDVAGLRGSVIIQAKATRPALQTTTTKVFWRVLEDKTERERTVAFKRFCLFDGYRERTRPSNISTCYWWT